MIVELLLTVTPLDGSKGFDAKKEFPSMEMCVDEGTRLKAEVVTKFGDDVRVDFTCLEKAAEQAAGTAGSAVPLWRGLRTGMSPAEVTAELLQIPGVKSVTPANGTLIIKTDRTFTLAGTPASILVSFNGGLSRVHLKSASYCSYPGSAGLDPVWEVSDVLSQKYEVAVDFAGSNKDFTDGKTRMQLREVSDNMRCGAGVQRHYNLSYLSELDAQLYDKALIKTMEEENRKKLDEF